MEGRRYSDGLHQAIEAKEGVPIQDETKTSASITYQNLFRMYKKLSGMTGTGKTEEENSVKSTTFVLFQSQQTVLFNVLTTQTFFMQVSRLSLRRLSKTLRLVTKRSACLGWYSSG